ncbi:RNA-dependent RNA polymerase [Niveomyces insectorum RCEF 264]|uniref:RNA-dependent RNA polymerase n=1 Tax=Niveomyces insectorum RCEF 264 TaxID=1081102 RepID=A0A167Q9C7_9HYPO|nr:RNA-dependent RNA polymerase [Niveomyces insectorum RCEF 264]
MEVFIGGLPAQANLSERGLRVQLQPFMKKLGIADTVFDCEKPLKKQYGFVVFLRVEDGLKFLAAYGAPKPAPAGRSSRFNTTTKVNANPASRLTILGAPVYCKQSNKTPDAITLRGLSLQNDKAGKRQAHPQQQQQQQQQQQRTDDRANSDANLSSFTLTSLSCGYYRFVRGRLTFVPEVVERQGGLAVFGKKHLTIERNDGVVIHIPHSTIQEIVWWPSGSLTLTLSTVPLFFSAKVPAKENKRSRLTALNLRHGPGRHGPAVLGMCLIYRLAVRPEQMPRKMQKLSNLGVFTISRFDVLDGAVGPDFSQSFYQLRSLLAAATAKSLLPFSLLVQLQALAQNAYLHPDTVAGLTRRLCEMHAAAAAADGRPPVSVEAMKKLFQAIDWPTPDYDDPADFEVPALVDYLLATERAIQASSLVREGLAHPGGDNVTAVHRVVVTPTRMTLHGPELENKNRVLRKYPNHQDYFIRVQFCDEDGQNLRFNGRVDFDSVYHRFKEIMVDGIQVAGRTYSFLGWSHSSLRAHSMWFAAPFIDDGGKLQTFFTITQTLGNFSTIHSPARCAARIGQAFSETPFAVPLAAHNISVVRMPDVLSADKQRTFSDGVGTVTREVAAAIWTHLPQKKKKKDFPTCFQIRYAGAKGMLSLDTRPAMAGPVIRLRPSMIKFASDETAHLEICDVASSPIPLYLNRQLIKILEDMGVPLAWFLRLQSDAVRELRFITASAYNMASFLKAQGVAQAIKLHKLLRLADQHGLDYRTEPFLRRITEAVVLRELRLLKHKARMLVPLGITLFGVMDETGFLGEGERARHVVPPRDHALRDLRNCIVFSARGARDLPSQLSGGDLDGDIFNVLWDPAVCELPTLSTFAPADYPRQAPVDIGRPVTKEDIAHFFIDFMKTDHLGAIATRHMILADQLEDGTLDADCIAVAAMHSTAVDFSKTGIPADLRQLPRANKFRPDFLSPGPITHLYSRADIELEDYVDEGDGGDRHDLDAPSYRYYASEKALGVLYRAVDEGKIWYDDVRRPVGTQKPAFRDAFLDWAGAECRKLGCYRWAHKTDEALRIRSAYEDAVLSAMHEYSEHPTLPITELEVFIGSIINRTGAQTTRQRDRSRKLRDAFERISAWITAQIRPHHRADDFAEGEKEDDENKDEDEDDSNSNSNSNSRLDTLALCWAAACLRVHDEDDVESFWLVAAAALLREIEFVKHAQAEEAAWQVEADLGALLPRLSLAA